MVLNMWIILGEPSLDSAITHRAICDQVDPHNLTWDVVIGGTSYDNGGMDIDGMGAHRSPPGSGWVCPSPDQVMIAFL